MHWRKNLPYSSTTYAGDGFALVGDASAFIDPFYSPGMDWIAKGIHERRRISDQREAVPCEGGAVIGQVFAPMHIALAPLCLGQNLARHRMLHQEIFEPLTQRTILGPGDEALIKHDANTDVASL